MFNIGSKCPFDRSHYLRDGKHSILLVGKGDKFGYLFDVPDPTGGSVWPDVDLSHDISEMDALLNAKDSGLHVAEKFVFASIELLRVKSQTEKREVTD